MDVLNLLDYLNEVIENATEIPITGKIVLHKKDTLELIKKILHVLPDELKRSKWIISERDRIIGEAKKFSEDVMREAKERIDKEIQEHDIVVEAKNKANKIVESAKNDAKAIKCGVSDYVKEVLKVIIEDVEKNKNEALKSIDECHETRRNELILTYKDMQDKVLLDLNNIK